MLKMSYQDLIRSNQNAWPTFRSLPSLPPNRAADLLFCSICILYNCQTFLSTANTWRAPGISAEIDINHKIYFQSSGQWCDNIATLWLISSSEPSGNTMIYISNSAEIKQCRRIYHKFMLIDFV